LEYAIDKQTIIDNVGFGNTHVVDTAVSWIVAPYGGDYNTVDQGYTGDWAIVPRDYDPVKAAQLLDAAGWVLKDGVRQKGGVKMENVEMPYYEDFVGLAEAIPAYWAELGIFIDPLPIEHNSFFDGIEASEYGLEQPDFGGGPYPLGLNTMGGGPDPAGVEGWIVTRNSYALGSWDTGGDNFGFYSNLRVDELFELGGAAQSYAERKEFYDEMQYLVHQDAAFLMLWNKWKVDAWNNNFAGFGTNRPIAWYGRYFRGDDGSSNVENGVYWRGGTVDKDPVITTVTSEKTVTDVTSVTVPEFMNMVAAFGLVLFSSAIIYRRRRREE
jgi:ABC-type transport system substrate-binding protein